MPQATSRAKDGPESTTIGRCAPNYNVYQCSDGGWISLGALEPHFWANLCRVMEREDFIPFEFSPEKRDEIFAHFRERFKTKPRDAWFETLKQTDICAAPVYGLDEALVDPHNVARDTTAPIGSAISARASACLNSWSFRNSIVHSR